MNFLFYGAGAIGTYIGVSLANQGHNVVFLEREEALESLRQNGLKLIVEEETLRIKNPQVAASLDAALDYGPFDLIVFALKAYDTPTAAQAMAAYSGRLPLLLCLQNGVENEAVLANALGEDQVIAGTVTSAVGRNDVGDVVLERLRGVGISATHPDAHEIAEALNQAGLNARLYARPADMKWSKMLTNLPANASSAILGMKPGEIYNHPELFRLEKAQMTEALAVMRRLKYQVVDLPDTPVRALVFAVQHLPEKLARGVLARGVGGGRGSKMPSFYIDLQHGRKKSEVEYLNGAVVRAGRQLGLATPANQVLTETLLALAQGELSRGEFQGQPQKLLQLFSAQKARA